MKPATLYPALTRLREEGAVEVEWGERAPLGATSIERCPGLRPDLCPSGLAAQALDVGVQSVRQCSSK